MDQNAITTAPDSGAAEDEQAGLGLNCADAQAIRALETDDLEAHICELAAHISAAEARFVALVSEDDERMGWARWECHSCAHWLEWKCAIGPGAARERVRVARALRQLPLIYKEFANGRLSFSQVRALTRTASPENEEELIDRARLMTAAQLEDAIRAMNGAISNDQALARAEERALTWYYDDDGCLVFKARVTPEQGAIVIPALESIVAELEHEREVALEADEIAEREVDGRRAGAPARGPGSGAKPPTKRQIRADALVRMAESALAETDPPVWSREQRHVLIHVDSSVLAGGDGRANLQDGPAISAEAVEKISCDSAVTAIYEKSPGEVLEMGRTSRNATSKQRRAIAIRDKHCRYPGCRNAKFMKIHHIWHWAKGGPTDISNLVAICSFHHDAIHDRDCTLFKRPDGRIVARTAAGLLLKASESLPGTSDGVSAIVEANESRGVVLDQETATPDWDGSSRNQAREALLMMV